MVKQNITIIGLPKKFTKKVSKAFADFLEMFYADVNELLEYELIDIDRAKKLSGNDFIKKATKSKIKQVAGFENTVINLDYATLTEQDNYKLLVDNALMVYVKVNEQQFEKLIKSETDSVSKQKIEKDMFEIRDKFCNDICEVLVMTETLNVKKVVMQIVKQVSSYYL